MLFVTRVRGFGRIGPDLVRLTRFCRDLLRFGTVVMHDGAHGSSFRGLSRT